MTRPLKADERDVLAYVVLDPKAWWEHAQTVFDEKRAEEALAAKVARWKPAYEAACADEDYMPRAKAEKHKELKAIVDWFIKGA